MEKRYQFPGEMVVLDPESNHADGYWMAALLRHLPTTPLDELRAWLAGYVEGDAAALYRLHQVLQQLRQMALPELGGRLTRPTSSLSLKRFILGLTTKFDWPEWVPWILPALQQERDLGVFDEGCAALGRLEVRSAWEALQKLSTQRTDADHQLILQRELGALESHQALSFYLGRLLEGESNPRLAHQGARGLATVAEPSDLHTLEEALEGADPLAYGLLLRALAELPGGTAGALLIARVQDTVHTLEDLESLDALTHRVQVGARTAARSELALALAARMEARAASAVKDLQRSLDAGEAGNPLPVLDQLHQQAKGPYERFLTEALIILVEGKIARFSAMVTEAQDMVAKRRVLLGNRLNQICDGLVRQVRTGRVDLGGVLPVLQQAFESYPQSEGLDHAFCCLVPGNDQEGLGQLLKVADPKRRRACLDTLGAREEDTLVPFFLSAVQDPIVEVGLRAMNHLGKLPSGFPAVMALFHSDRPEQVRTALGIFTENGTQAAAEPLMAFLKTDVRDNLLVEGVEALGAIRHPAAAPVLLDLLHDGKPIRLQEVLVEALANLATPEASLGLLSKAANLKAPQVLIVALEGALAAFPGFERPLPQEALPLVERLFTRCCDDREGEGQRMRAIMATLSLFCFDQELYARLKDSISDFLFDLRTKGDWDRESNERVAAVVKELGRRSASLGHIAGKEEKVRALLQGVPHQGPQRTPSLLAVREALQDPEFIMRAELAQELAAFVLGEFGREEPDWRALARLCEIGGLTRQITLADSLKEVFLQATGLGLRSAAKEALLALGLDESAISRRPPIKSILLLDASAFFRKRLMTALSQGWEVREAGSRTEAEPLLSERPVDLIISEQSDQLGDLHPWLKLQCETRHCRQVLLSTAARSTHSGEPWLLGVLHKPYLHEQLFKALEP